MLTLPDEINYAWRPKTTWITTLFLANRYMVFAVLLEVLWMTFADGRFNFLVAPNPKPNEFPDAGVTNVPFRSVRYL